MKNLNKAYDWAPPGFKILGSKKNKLIDQADQMLAYCHLKGVKTGTLLKLVGLNELNPSKTTTKQWTGIVSVLKQFMIDNDLVMENELLPYKESCFNAHERIKAKWRRENRS